MEGLIFIDTDGKVGYSNDDTLPNSITFSSRPVIDQNVRDMIIPNNKYLRISVESVAPGSENEKLNIFGSTLVGEHEPLIFGEVVLAFWDVKNNSPFVDVDEDIIKNIEQVVEEIRRLDGETDAPVYGTTVKDYIKKEDQLDRN
jgi:hypothetical protein